MSEKPHAPACERNREPILTVLRRHFADRHRVLEIGSGTGQHAVFFGAALPHLECRALTNRPAVIFADEPTGDLDSGTGKQVMDLLKKFHDETKTTIIVITHEQDVAEYAERQVMIEDGIIVPTQ